MLSLIHTTLCSSVLHLGIHIFILLTVIPKPLQCHKIIKCFILKIGGGTSLVVQWLRISCQCRGHRFEPWSRKIPHAVEQLSHTPQLLSLRSRARKPQLRKPVSLQPMLCNKRSHSNEKPAHHKEEYPPLTTTRESPHAARKTQCSQK